MRHKNILSILFIALYLVLSSLSVNAIVGHSATQIYPGQFGSGNFTFDGNIWADAFYYNSDIRLKDNITPLVDPLGKVSQLDGVSFVWKASGRESIGLIAQDVELVYPQIIGTDADGMKSINYPLLVAPLIEAVKEQQQQIDALQAELQMLRAEIEELKAR